MIKREILRYLGYKKAVPDENVSRLIDELLLELRQAVVPCFTYKILPLKVDFDEVSIENLTIKSSKLAKNLQGCEQVVVFAATLGTKADLLIKKYSITEMSKAVILQSCAAALIEEFCDSAQNEIESQLENAYLRPRFSAGYGDFDIKHQRDILNILDASKKIGLCLTQSFMMVPTKSVTALIGVANGEKVCAKSGCETCDKKDCLFRREN